MEPLRDHWSSRAGFVLAAAGSAIGLGNLWKFPYITWENEGGAFVLVYLVCIAVVGFPIMMAEILIGRSSQKSPVGALREAVGPGWGAVGFLGITTGFIILGYYTVIAGWSLRNFVVCLRWSFGEGAPDANAVAQGFGTFLGTPSLQLLVTLLFMSATMFVVARGIGKGIERVARALMPVLFGILLILLVTAFTMDGAKSAMKFIFVPRFGQLSGKAVLEALGHSFFTLSLGMGAMITYGSYMNRKESVVRASLVVVILDTVIALIATIVMFSVIFSVPGLADTIHESKSAVGMLFVALPELFYREVTFGVVLAPLFYVLVAFAALTSTVSLLEVVVSYFVDERKMSRAAATTVSGGAIVVLSILCSMSLGAVPALSAFEVFGGKAGLLDTLDHLASNWLLPIGGFLITLAAGWFMTRERTESELVDDNTPTWFRYGAWRFTMRFIAPIAVGAIILAVIVFGKDFS